MFSPSHSRQAAPGKYMNLLLHPNGAGQAHVLSALPGAGHLVFLFFIYFFLKGEFIYLFIY